MELLGKPVPDFSLPLTGDATFRLSEARGKKRVLYSRDSLKSREGFKVRMKFPFALLSGRGKRSASSSAS